MEDICFAHFSGIGCKKENCGSAHEFSQLRNIDQWVMFAAPKLEMLDFLAYKYHSHPYFKVYKLPQGPLVRFATVEDALLVTCHYKSYYNPLLLSNVNLSRDGEKPDSALPPTGSQASAETGSPKIIRRLSSDAFQEVSSLGYSGESVESLDNWADSDPGLESGPEIVPENAASGYENAATGYEDAATGYENAATGYENYAPQCCCGCAFEGVMPTFPPFVGFPVYAPVDFCCAYPCYPTNVYPGSQPMYAPKKSKPNFRTNVTDSCTETVLNILRENPELRRTQSCGWAALEQIWGLGRENFDNSVLRSLDSKNRYQQEQILLSFAAIDLRCVHNLSAYLNSLIREHENSNQVCLYFLAGLCEEPECNYVHPVNTLGWKTLEERWQLSYRNLDYAVLNYLSKKAVPEQDEILLSLAAMNLSTVHNLSAYLSSHIQKHESQEKSKQNQYKSRPRTQMRVQPMVADDMKGGNVGGRYKWNGAEGKTYQQKTNNWKYNNQNKANFRMS